MNRKATIAAIGAALTFAVAYHAPAIAQSAPAQKARQTEPIYGYTMMSDAERNEYREKMRNARTAQEREALRNEHRTDMEARMKERGMEPGQMRGRGAGPAGPGVGQGAGPRGPGASPGAGPGKGRGGPGAGYGPGGGVPAQK